MVAMTRPAPTEAAPYYFKYIDQVEGDDVLGVLRDQLRQAERLAVVSDQRSLFRPAPEKWSIRQVLGHINDAERLFAFRAFWFARGLELPLPSFDQEIASRFADADQIEWQQHLNEFRNIRASTIALFENLTPEAWTRTGIASDAPFSVRAFAFIAAGHFAHHLRILRDHYGLAA